MFIHQTIKLELMMVLSNQSSFLLAISALEMAAC